MFEGGCLVLLVFLAIVYAIVCTIEDKIDNDYDETTEARCKRCVNYTVCSRHGSVYNCKYYHEEDDDE